MQPIEVQRKSIGFAAVLGALALFASALMLFFALRFRLAAGPGDESDIAIGILSIYLSPLFVICFGLGFQRNIAFHSRLLLWGPAVLTVLSVAIASIGVVGRP